MLEYAISFYNNHTIIFYLLLIVAVILEGPIIILTLSILAPKFGFSFIGIYILAFFGEFLGDILHFSVGRIFHKGITKFKSYLLLEKINDKLSSYSLIDKIIVIKYFPPITNIGLIYLGLSKLKFMSFLSAVSLFAIFNGLIITGVGYNFGLLLKDKVDLERIILGLCFAILIIFVIFKLLGKLVFDKYIKN